MSERGSDGKKTKILVECPAELASVRVGVLEPLRPLEERGLCAVRFLPTRQIKKADIAWCDVLVTVRGSELPTLYVVEAAKAAGRFIVYFLDDDLLHVPDLGPAADNYRDLVTAVYAPKNLALCDALWVVNRNVAEQYGRWCSRRVLLRVPARVLREPPETERLRVVYAAGADHAQMARELLAPAAKRLMEEFPGRIDFTFIGPDPGCGDAAGIEYIPFFPNYDEYRRAMLTGDFAVGLAPGWDTPFFHCKYYNKFVEYASFGIAGIYSAWEPYTQIVRHEENGLLCPGGAEAWYELLRRCLEEPALVRRCAQGAEEELRQRFTHAEVADELLRQLPELAEYRARALPPRRVRLKSVGWYSFRERFRLYWRAHGVWGLPLLPWKAAKLFFRWCKERYKGRKNV